MGAIGGGVSGCFLQTFAGTVVTASGSVNEPTVVEQAVVQGLTGAVVGGITVLVAGFMKHSFDHHSSS